MKDRERIARDRDTIGDGLLKSVESCCTTHQVDSLLALIRLVVEFEEYLQRTVTGRTDADESQYVCGSVFSGVDSFDSFAHAYKILVGSETSRVEWDSGAWRFETLRSRYLELYEELVGGGTFQRGCRLVLDLFKLQIVWAGVEYRW